MGDVVISEPTLGRYLARLGLAGPVPPTLDGLRTLHVAHLEQVPFENLSIHRGESIVLDTDALVAKLVDHRRGGFCYELNGAFAALLRTLGFEVILLAARVFDGDQLSQPFDHLCLRVELEEPWLVDVGFGDNFRAPLSLATPDDQPDAAGTFAIVPGPAGHLDVLRDGAPQYRFGLTAHELADFAAMCEFHRTSPRSHFTSGTVCSRATPTGRITLRDDRLIVTDRGDRSERMLSPEEVPVALREHFGIDLPAPSPR